MSFGAGDGLPVAGGVPDLSGTLIPENFSKEFLRVLYYSLILFSIANTSFEGELFPGGAVDIRSVPEVTITDDVQKGTDLTYDELDSTITQLKIDKSATWGFRVRTADKVLSDLDFSSAAATTAALRLKERVEKRVFADIYTQAHADNKGLTAGADNNAYNMGVTGDPLVLTASNAIQFLAEVGAVLAEQNVPDDTGSQFLLLPPAAITILQQSDLKSALVMGDPQSILRKRMRGYVGSVNNLDIYSTRQLAKGVDGTTNKMCYNAIFGHRYAMGFAGKPTEEAVTFTDPNRPGKIVRSEYIYGWKAIKPEMLGTAYIQTVAT